MQRLGIPSAENKVELRFRRGLAARRSLGYAWHLCRGVAEDDNFSYTYIRITGSAIEILERGYGADPWDPNKTVVQEFGA